MVDMRQLQLIQHLVQAQKSFISTEEFNKRRPAPILVKDWMENA